MLFDYEGQWIDEEAQIKSLVNSFYKDLFSDDSSMGIGGKLCFFFFPAIEDRLMEYLNEPLSIAEIKCAVFDLSAWKSPGSDKFPVGFYQFSWDMLGGTIL